MKSKFKVMDILRLIEKQHNMTKGGLYCANQVFELDSDIPIIETVDDYGLVVSLYETSFEATDVVLDYSGKKVRCCFNIYKRPVSGLNSKPNYKTEVIEVREEEAKAVIKQCVREFFCMCEHDDSKGFIDAIQYDKDLQRALLVLIGEQQ